MNQHSFPQSPPPLTFPPLGTTELLGQHYFVANSAGGINPKFDFTSESKKGDSTAFVVLKKATDVVSFIEWLSIVALKVVLACPRFRGR